MESVGSGDAVQKWCNLVQLTATWCNAPGGSRERTGKSVQGPKSELARKTEGKRLEPRTDRMGKAFQMFGKQRVYLWFEALTGFNRLQ